MAGTDNAQERVKLTPEQQEAISLERLAERDRNMIKAQARAARPMVDMETAKAVADEMKTASKQLLAERMANLNNLAQQYKASALKVKQFDVDIAAKDITRREELLDRRQADINAMRARNDAYFAEFGGTLNESALKFLRDMSNIPAPTFTAILAGWEGAKASRAEMAAKYMEQDMKMLDQARQLEQMQNEVLKLRDANNVAMDKANAEIDRDRIDEEMKVQGKYDEKLHGSVMDAYEAVRVIKTPEDIGVAGDGKSFINRPPAEKDKNAATKPVKDAIDTPEKWLAAYYNDMKGLDVDAAAEDVLQRTKEFEERVPFPSTNGATTAAQYFNTGHGKDTYIGQINPKSSEDKANAQKAFDEFRITLKKAANAPEAEAAVATPVPGQVDAASNLLVPKDPKMAKYPRLDAFKREGGASSGIRETASNVGSFVSRQSNKAPILGKAIVAGARAMVDDAVFGPERGKAASRGEKYQGPERPKGFGETWDELVSSLRESYRNVEDVGTYRNIYMQTKRVEPSREELLEFDKLPEEERKERMEKLLAPYSPVASWEKVPEPPVVNEGYEYQVTDRGTGPFGIPGRNASAATPRSEDDSPLTAAEVSAYREHMRNVLLPKLNLGDEDAKAYMDGFEEVVKENKRGKLESFVETFEQMVSDDGSTPPDRPANPEEVKQEGSFHPPAPNPEAMRAIVGMSDNDEEPITIGDNTYTRKQLDDWVKAVAAVQNDGARDADGNLVTVAGVGDTADNVLENAAAAQRRRDVATALRNYAKGGNNPVLNHVTDSWATKTGIPVDAVRRDTDSYLETTAMAESGWDTKIKNPNSSATGVMQFIDKTFKRMKPIAARMLSGIEDDGGFLERLNAAKKVSDLNEEDQATLGAMYAMSDKRWGNYLNNASMAFDAGDQETYAENIRDNVLKLHWRGNKNRSDYVPTYNLYGRQSRAYVDRSGIFDPVEEEIAFEEKDGTRYEIPNQG